MSDWVTATVGEVATGFLSGGTPTTKRAEYWEGKIPWITSKWLGQSLELNDGEKFVSEDAVKKTSTKIVPKDSIIFATRVGVGKVGINRIDLAINQDLAGILIDNQKCDIKFLAYQLGIDSIQQYVAMNKRGATIKGITRDCLKAIRLNLPLLPEQKKIAHILSTVQRAIEAQERIIQTTTELKKALMHKLFTEGLRNEPQKQTEIGPIPESWKVVELGALFQIKHGFAFDGKFFEPLGEYILMTPGHFNEEGGFRDQGEKTKYFTGEIPQDYVLAKGDLVVAMTEQKSGLLGSSAFVPEDGRYLHNQRLGLIVDLDTTRLSKQFLFNVFNLPHLRVEVAKTSTGSKVKHTSPTKLRAVKVGIPPTLEEQGEIASALSTVQQKIGVATNKKAQLQDLFRTLLHELMTAKTRVYKLEITA
ncbi:MAG: restriction endonuclease subunit S [Candidatus Thiodiazotropha sp.]